MVRRMAAIAISVAAGVGSLGCMRFEWASEPTPQVIAQSPTRVWVPIGVDSFAILQGARIVNDTLTGLIEGSAAAGHPLVRFSEPVLSVPRIAVERPNVSAGFRSTLAVGGIVLTGLLATVIVGVGQ